MRLVLALCALLFAFHPRTAGSETFPSRSVRLIVPNPPGGSNDTSGARPIAQALSEIWQQPVVVENRAGAGGNIGVQAAAMAAPDGYTYLLSSPGPITINPSLYKKLPFGPEKDFVPIALVATVPIVLMVEHKNARQNGRRTCSSLAKEADGRMNFASSGIGSTHHLAAELFQEIDQREPEARSLSRGGSSHERSDRRPCANFVRRSFRRSSRRFRPEMCELLQLRRSNG